MIPVWQMQRRAHREEGTCSGLHTGPELPPDSRPVLCGLRRSAPALEAELKLQLLLSCPRHLHRAGQRLGAGPTSSPRKPHQDAWKEALDVGFLVLAPAPCWPIHLSVSFLESKVI